jgi:hypothetical protein
MRYAMKRSGRAIALIIGCFLPIVVVALLTMMPSPALAAPGWQICEATSEGSFEDEGCTKETAGGLYEWLTLTEAETISGTSTVELEDSAEISGALRIKCGAEISETLENETEGTITGLELNTCKVVKGTCESPTAKAINLPWKTELTETGSEYRDDIQSDGSGTPGYVITCSGSLKVEDKCEFGTASVGLVNISTEGLVEAKFDASSGKATCNHGEKCPTRSATGTIEGSIKAKATLGHGIRVAPKPAPPHWYVNGVRLGESNEAGGLNVRTGNPEEVFDFLDLGRREAKCTVSDAGKIWNPVGGDWGHGVITGMSFPACKAANYCAVNPTLTARGLNWGFHFAVTAAGAVVAVIPRMELEFGCNGVNKLYKGPTNYPAVFARIYNGTGAGEAACPMPNHTTFIAFSSASSLLIAETTLTTANLGGNDCIWGEAAEEKITVASP